MTAALSLTLLAAGAGPIDQQQPDLGDLWASICPVGVSGSYQQEVTPAAPQWEVISLALAYPISGAPEPVALEVRAGDPQGPALASAVGVVPGPGIHWVDFTFSPPVDLTPGVPVYLSAQIDDRVGWIFTTYDSYAGGARYAGFCDVQNRIPDEDFAFITYAPSAPARDRDGDGLDEDDEAAFGTDPDDADTDGDGIPDGRDPDIAVGVVDALPATAFRSPGVRNALTARLAAVEELVAAGDSAGAVAELENIRRRVDGCADAGGTPDTNDWVVECAAQVEVRRVLDLLIVNLGG